MAFPKLIILALLAAQTCVAVAQGRPDQLPQDFNATGTDEVYMQNRNDGSANPVPRRMDFATMRTYFGAGVKEVGYVPAATGNIDRNVVAVDPNGAVHFIDYLGRAVRISTDGSGIRVTYLVGQNLTAGGSTVVLPFTPTRDEQLRVYRNPCYYHIGLKVTRSGSTLTFTDYAFESNETITVHYLP